MNKLAVLFLLCASVAKADSLPEGISQIRPDYGNGFLGDPIWVLTNGPDFLAYTLPDSLPGFGDNLVDIICTGLDPSETCFFQYYYLFGSYGNIDYYNSVQINNSVEIVGFDQPSTQATILATPEPPTILLVLVPCLLIGLKRLLWRS